MKNYLCVNFRFPSIFTDNRKILLEMMFIPPGVVNVGSPCDEKDRDENENLQQFKISTGFLIGKYPVTNAQYFALVENWRRPSEKIHRNCIPVESVSFRQAKNFCEKLSKLFGEKFTLPTEAEWVHACLAGRPGPFPLGHPETYPSRYYNSVSTYREEKPLTRMQPQNAWGVQGMQGYLWQWCVDSLDYNRGILKGGSSAQHWSAWRAGSKLTNCEKRSFDMAGGYGFRIKMELNKNQLDQINSATGTQIEFNDSLSAHKRYFLVPEKVIKGETITKEIATEFIDEYDYSRFRDITEEAAIILGNEIGNLDLTGLEKLDANVAAALSKRKGSLLFDLVDITDEAAKEISNHSDDLIFFRLASLSSISAGHLSHHKGRFLAIDGLVEITEENASELSRHKGNLRLSSVKSLTEKTAELLSGTQGQLILSGLAEIGDTESHAKLFGKLLENQGEFELKNLKNLSSKAAAFLPLRTGSYIFPNLNQIDDETAGFFGRIPGNGRLLLDGLKELSPSAATALGQFQGFCLSLDGLKALSREAASGLANFGGSILSLKGLNPQSLEVRIISDSYQGRLNIQHTLPED